MTKQYIHRIDAIRGIAILLVLLYHTLSILQPSFEEKEYSNYGILLIKNPKSFLLNFNPIGQGWIGVELFLLISGFLIHLIYLQNKGDFKWTNFYSKRFWRIFPPYLFVLIFLFIHRPDFSKTGLTSFFSHVFLVHNLSDTTFFKVNPSFWSIALESQLYLIYPAYLFLLKRFDSFKTTLILFAISIGMTLIAYFFGIKSITYETLVLKFWFIWGVGAFLADRYFKNIRIFNKPFIWFVFFYSLLFIFKLFLFTNYFILVPASLSCLALIETLLYSQFPDKYYASRIIMKFLSYIGVISYSIYLTHQPYLDSMLIFFSPYFYFNYLNILISIVFSYVAIFAISYSTYKLLELKSIEYGKLARRTTA